MKHHPTRVDAFILSLFTVLITFNPFYLFREINIFELGIYLPGIQAVLDGLIPYRDFFHLRGPLEVYVPALLMKLFGEELAIVPTYFYVGTVICLITYVWLAKEIISNRLLFYLFVPVLVARTFPRVVFTYWGGMRFALGAFCLLFIVKYFKTQQKCYLFLSGLCTGLAFLTSIEIGVCSMFAIGVSIIIKSIIEKEGHNREMLFNSSVYLCGCALTTIPFLIYLMIHGALVPYIDSVLTVISNMQNVFLIKESAGTPQNFGQTLKAMIPGMDHFKYMTPMYAYLFFALYLIKQRKRLKDIIDLHLILPITVYGLSMYILAFRNLEGAQFEMILQPEKILLFYLIQTFLKFAFSRQAILKEQIKHGKSDLKKKIAIGAVYVYCIGLIGSSLGYAFDRFNKRFFSYKYAMYKISGREVKELLPFFPHPFQEMHQRRIKGLVLPAKQASDFEMLTQWIRVNTKKSDPILFMDELALYHFIVDRPFVYRFPMVSFSWLKEQWHEQFFAQIKSVKPQVIVNKRDKDSWFEDIYFQVQGNKEKYDQIEDLIQSNYVLAFQTPSLNVYKYQYSPKF